MVRHAKSVFNEFEHNLLEQTSHMTPEEQRKEVVKECANFRKNSHIVDP
jgi:hypothetical protein